LYSRLRGSAMAYRSQLDAAYARIGQLEEKLARATAPSSETISIPPPLRSYPDTGWAPKETVSAWSFHIFNIIVLIMAALGSTGACQ